MVQIYTFLKRIMSQIESLLTQQLLFGSSDLCFPSHIAKNSPQLHSSHFISTTVSKTNSAEARDTSQMSRSALIAYITALSEQLNVL